jgi:hypothetical protein
MLFAPVRRPGGGWVVAPASVRKFGIRTGGNMRAVWWLQKAG